MDPLRILLGVAIVVLAGAVLYIGGHILFDKGND
jgi:hypothetical protein